MARVYGTGRLARPARHDDRLTPIRACRAGRGRRRWGRTGEDVGAGRRSPAAGTADPSRRRKPMPRWPPTHLRPGRPDAGSAAGLHAAQITERLPLPPRAPLPRAPLPPDRPASRTPSSWWPNRRAGRPGSSPDRPTSRASTGAFSGTTGCGRRRRCRPPGGRDGGGSSRPCGTGPRAAPGSDAGPSCWPWPSTRPGRGGGRVGCWSAPSSTRSGPRGVDAAHVVVGADNAGPSRCTSGRIRDRRPLRAPSRDRVPPHAVGPPRPPDRRRTRLSSLASAPRPGGDRWR